MGNRRAPYPQRKGALRGWSSGRGKACWNVSRFAVGAAPRGRPAAYSSDTRYAPRIRNTVGRGLAPAALFSPRIGWCVGESPAAVSPEGENFLNPPTALFWYRGLRPLYPHPFEGRNKAQPPMSPRAAWSVLPALRNRTRLNPACCRPWAGEGPSAPDGEAPCVGGPWGVGP